MMKQNSKAGLLPRNCRNRFDSHGQSTRSGLTLLEVVLSIAILGISMVVIANTYFLGVRNAMRARLRSDASLLCDAKMAELAAGVISASSASAQSIPENPDWTYSVDVQSSMQTGLLVATVSVEQSGTGTSNPVSLSIVRFIPDPDYVPEEESEEEE